MRYILSLFLLTGLLTSCKKDKSTQAFIPTKIPLNINNLFEFKGDLNSDTVWIYVQGGPVTQRDYAFEELYDDGSDLYPFIKDDLRVYPYQAQHLNKNIADEINFDFNDAKIESATSSEIVKLIVEHFNKQSKVVYLVGHSFGSFIVNDVLARYGSIARKTISLNGRLEMDDLVWKGFAKGEVWLFNAQGLNPTLNTSATSTTEEKNMRKLAAGLGYKRFTELYVNTDLSDAIFLSGEDDPYVGDFTQNTKDFLTSRAEELFIIPNFGHSDVFHPDVMKQLHDIIIVND